MSESTVKCPQVRIRLNHKYTAKDGWRLDETTVEVEGELGATTAAWVLRQVPAPDRAMDLAIDDVLSDLSADAFKAGEEEAQRRNNLDRHLDMHSVPEPGDAVFYHETIAGKQVPS